MRHISIDLSSDNYLERPQIFGGYAGEHNETILQVKLPKRMIDIECSGYRFDFQTSEDNKISSPLIPVSKLNNGILSFNLTEQLTIGGKLLFKVVAILSSENTVSLISKTNTVILHIEDSLEGNVHFFDPNGHKDMLQQMVEELIKENSAGKKTSLGGEIFNDYENNQANTLYSHAEGYNTLAGAKVFWASEGSVENKTYTLDSVEGIEVGDYYSYKCVPNEEAGITYNGTFDFWGTITGINGNIVTVSDFVRGQNNAFQSGYFWIPRKPTIGTIIPELELWQHTEGSNTRAIMGAGHAEGTNTVASGRWSHSEGKGTIAGYGSHAEGRGTEARGLDSHSEGFHTVAQDEGAHAEGDHTVAKGNGAHVEGIGKTSNVADEFAGGMRPDETYGALATAAHSEGYQTKATATAAHSEGKTTIASGNDSHAEGAATRAEGHHSHSEGSDTQATADNSHAEGGITEANGSNSHAEGLRSVTSGGASHAEGSNTQSQGARAHTEGDATYASGYASHAEGGGSSNQYAIDKQSTYGAFGDYSHSEGLRTTAIGKASHTEGENTQAVTQNSHAEGYNTIAKGYASHAEGEQTTTESSHAHAEGFNTEAKEDSAHAEGYATHAYGIGAHSEGYGSVAEAQGAHAEGINTIAPIEGSHAQGKYNKITKDILTNVPLDGVIRTEAINDISKTDIGVTWNLNTTSGANHYCFSYSEFSVGKTYKLKFTLDVSNAATTDLNFFAWEDLSKINSSGNRVELAVNKRISLVKGKNTIYITVTLRTYPYLAMRFYNSSAVDATVTLTKLEIVDEEIDENIISSIGNGFDEDNRSNAFTVYKDGHAEVGKMGNGDLSVATKKYVDNNVKAINNTFANALKGSKNGSTILIDDISPITHKLSVKLSGNAIGDEYITYAEGYTTSGVDFEFEQLPDTILKTSPINSSERYNEFSLIHADGNYTFLISVGELVGYEGDVYYTKIVLGDKPHVYYYSDSNYTTLIGSWFSNYSKSSPIVGIRFNASQIVYYTAQTKYIPLTSVKVIAKNNNGETVAEYTPNADGTVDGVKSLYPTTILSTDTDGVTIECEYNRDINKSSGIEVDLTEYVKHTDINQSYDPTSKNAQSGIAVAEALRTLDKKYELIETITLTEAVQQISRTSEPDGRAYNFKKLAIDYQSTESMSRVRVRGNYKYGNTIDGFNFYINATQAMGYVEIDATDIIKFYGAGGGATGYTTSWVTTGNFARIQKADGITSLIIEGTQFLYDGTVINIYGVRA